MEKQELYPIIQKHLDEGISLSDIQKILETEHDHRMTYMDLRLLSSDLEVNWKKIDGTDGPEVIEDEEAAPDSVVNADATLEGETLVNVSKLARPGAMIHGDVTFKSGKTADWYVDSMGRLGLNPTAGSQDPDEEDITDFQIKLQEAMQSGAMGGGMGGF